MIMQPLNGSTILTSDEVAIMDSLVDAWNRFSVLDEADPQSPNDRYDFGASIRHAQQVIILRGARRADPEYLLNPIIKRRENIENQYLKEDS